MPSAIAQDGSVSSMDTRERVEDDGDELDAATISDMLAMFDLVHSDDDTDDESASSSTTPKAARQRPKKRSRLPTSVEHEVDVDEDSADLEAHRIQLQVYQEQLDETPEAPRATSRTATSTTLERDTVHAVDDNDEDDEEDDDDEEEEDDSGWDRYSDIDMANLDRDALSQLPPELQLQVLKQARKLKKRLDSHDIVSRWLNKQRSTSSSGSHSRKRTSFDVRGGLFRIGSLLDSMTDRLADGWIT